MKKLQRTRNEILAIRLMRTAIVLLSGTLAFYARPTFGQHGGSGSGHTGSGHASGGGHSGGTVASSSGRSSSGSTYVSGQGGTSSFSSQGSPNAYAGSGSRLGSLASAESHFGGGNNTWIEPPAMQGRGTTPFGASAVRTVGAMTRAGAATAVDVHRPHVPIVGIYVPNAFMERNERLAEGPFLGTTITVRPPIVHKPRHFRNSHNFLIVGGCFDGFFPGLCGSAFWLGSGWGYGANCDPSEGCNGNGYLDGSPAGGYEMDLQSEAPSHEYGPFSWGEAPGFNSEEESPKARVPVVIYLRDGTSYGVTDYWLKAGRLIYLTTYGGENTIPVEMLDLQKTVDVNAALGVEFTLRNQRLGREQR